MKPGIYKDLSFEQYLEIDAVNNSALSNLARSPLHYKSCVEIERTKPLVIGSLVHCGRLEPLAMAERYAVMPDYQLDDENKTTTGERSQSKTTRYYKEKVFNFESVNSDKDVVEAGWYREAVAIVKSLHADEKSRWALDCDAYELTVVWEDCDTGLLCKARLDGIKAGSHLVDLKTTAELAKFPRAIVSYGYHRQLAHYQEGWAQLTGEILPPWITAIEKIEPYCCQTAPLTNRAIEIGLKERAELLQLLADCLEKDYWPGPESPEAWDVPDWLDTEPVEIVVNGEKVSL